MSPGPRALRTRPSLLRFEADGGQCASALARPCFRPADLGKIAVNPAIIPPALPCTRYRVPHPSPSLRRVGNHGPSPAGCPRSGFSDPGTQLIHRLLLTTPSRSRRNRRGRSGKPTRFVPPALRSARYRIWICRLECSYRWDCRISSWAYPYTPSDLPGSPAQRTVCSSKTRSRPKHSTERAISARPFQATGGWPGPRFRTYSIFGIGVDRKQILKWLFPKEKATLHRQ